MSYFLSDQYQKPKLVENKTLQIIIENQPIIQPVIKDTFFDDIFQEIIIIIKNNFKILFFILIIFLSLYWRYREIQQLKNNKDIDSEEEE